MTKPENDARTPARTIVALSTAALLVVAVNLVLFRTPLYRPLLAPASRAGSVDRLLAALRARRDDPSRDVLVLGDSRIYRGLLPEVASRASGGRLHFVGAAVPGTTPRVWSVLLRHADPDAAAYRAIVVPVDTLADDDSAAGSLDGDDREEDLHYLVYAAAPAEAVRIAGSFGDPLQRLSALTSLALRGPLLRDDVRAFLADPAARLRSLRTTPPVDPEAGHALPKTLAGLRADFATRRFSHVAGRLDAIEIAALTETTFRVPAPSAAYARYRDEWLGPIVARYRRAGRTVVFVRIPTRPIDRDPVRVPSGSVAGFAREGAVVLAPAPYLALERPRYFVDHDHLDRAGAERFSRLLGRDVARALGD